MSEIHYINNARNQKSTFDLSWTNVKIYHHDSNFDDLMEVLENELTSDCLAGIYHLPSRYVYKNLDKCPLTNEKKPDRRTRMTYYHKKYWTNLLHILNYSTEKAKSQKISHSICTYIDYLIKLVLSIFLEIFEFFCYVLCGPFAP